ncbi:hypothetical protein [Litorimonas haliclonae]|uniref:hypothetical protein n=1 Tax=Litorimonas haliclonae TaxID=2081977 RepID=UPI0039EF4AF8
MLRELNVNEMEIVSGGTQNIYGQGPEEVQANQDAAARGWGQYDQYGNNITDSFGGGSSGGTYAGGSVAFGLGANGYSSGGGQNDSGRGGAVIGMGGSFTIGQADNTDDAVVAAQESAQLCWSVCVNSLGNGQVTIGAGIIIPIDGVSGGKTPTGE